MIHERTESRAADTFPGLLRSLRGRQQKSPDAALLLKGLTHGELCLFTYYSSPLKKKTKKNGLTTVKIFSQQLLSLLHLRANVRGKKTDSAHFCFLSCFLFLWSEHHSRACTATVASTPMETSQVHSVNGGTWDFTASCLHIAVTECQ